MPPTHTFYSFTMPFFLHRGKNWTYHSRYKQPPPLCNGSNDVFCFVLWTLFINFIPAYFVCCKKHYCNIEWMSFLQIVCSSTNTACLNNRQFRVHHISSSIMNFTCCFLSQSLSIMRFFLKCFPVCLCLHYPG